MKYARIVDNKVWETYTPPTGVSISECFTVDVAALFIECPSDVEQNYTYDGTNFLTPVVQTNETIIVQE
jgi:hypothetical protein